MTHPADQCQECGRDLKDGPLIEHQHSEVPIPDNRFGAEIVGVDPDGVHLLMICRWCRDAA